MLYAQSDLSSGQKEQFLSPCVQIRVLAGGARLGPTVFRFAVFKH